ncbi:MAG: hypothetical protein HGA84_00740 [Syntrophobacteraceae bacterium]|nr:hypothetical protein [Syntrophobacteraceae bacterium]
MGLLSYLKHQLASFFSPGAMIRQRYSAFKSLLEKDGESHSLIARLQQFHRADISADYSSVQKTYTALRQAVSSMVENLNLMSLGSYESLWDVLEAIDSAVGEAVSTEVRDGSPPYTVMLDAPLASQEWLVGGKAARICAASSALKLPIPRGFVVTSRAFAHFFEAGLIRGEIDFLLADLDIRSPSSLEDTSRALMALVRRSPLPPSLLNALSEGCERVFGRENMDVSLCMRSSAVAEDGRFSFAGQYRTLLNVKPHQLPETYKEVVAAKYSVGALRYRIQNGLLDTETPMAVMVLEMIDAASSGIVYTRNPTSLRSDSLVIYSVWGLGEMLVKGHASPDEIEVDRGGTFSIVHTTKAPVGSKAELDRDGGLRTVHLSSREGREMSLDDDRARQLAAWGIGLESHFGEPQDIEWCLDKTGNLFLLQTRPLGMSLPKERSCSPPSTEPPGQMLVEGGETAAAGLGSGKVALVSSLADLARVEEGSVLVTRMASLDYAHVVGRLRAVVTDLGSVAGHFASIAREMKLPMLVNTGNATEILASGDMVTVDADSCRVFAGVQVESPDTECRLDPPQADTDIPFMRRLLAILEHVSPLHLKDPGDPAFSARNCRTFHDIVRFTHEKAVQEMFSMGKGGQTRLGKARRLKSEIPITLYVLDIGHGIDTTAHGGKEIVLENIRNPALRALWLGLSHPRVLWSDNVRHVDWKAFDQVSGGIMALDAPFLSSFAIVSKDYMNLNMRFGYHFAVVDAFCSPSPRENHLTFHFAGGGGLMDGRRLRAILLARILEESGFVVHLEEDVIEARLRKIPSSVLLDKLEILGRLLGSTKLLDMKLTDKSDVDSFVREFLAQ